MKQNNILNIKAKITAPNRTVCVTPLKRLACIRLGQSLRSFPRLIPAQFASPANLRFAYSGCQTVAYSRDVIRQFFYPKFLVTPRHPWRGEFILFILLKNK
jgi:hypothetical protein